MSPTIAMKNAMYDKLVADGRAPPRHVARFNPLDGPWFSSHREANCDDGQMRRLTEILERGR